MREERAGGEGLVLGNLARGLRDDPGSATVEVIELFARFFSVATARASAVFTEATGVGVHGGFFLALEGEDVVFAVDEFSGLHPAVEVAEKVRPLAGLPRIPNRIGDPAWAERLCLCNVRPKEVTL